MATTTDSYDGTGAQSDFTVTFPYTTVGFVTVYVDSVLQVLGTDYTFFTPTTIRFVVDPPIGTGNVEFIRVTSTTPLVDWVNGASILETNLDLADNQLLHVIEELENNSISSMGKIGANWDADSNRIVNVSPPIADTDVATKASIAAQVTAAELAETNAETAETNAQTAQTAAELAETNAETAETNAEAAEATITGVFPVSGLQTGRMLVVDTATTFVEARVGHWEYVGETATAAQSEVAITLEAGPKKFMLMLSQCYSGTTDKHLFLTVSDDDEVSYYAGTDYHWSNHSMPHTHSANHSLGDANARLIQSPINDAAHPAQLEVVIYPGNGIYHPMWKTDGIYFWTSNTAATFMSAAGGLTGGSGARLTDVKFTWETASTFGTFSGTISLYKWVG